MKISEVIKNLKALKKTHGDLPCAVLNDGIEEHLESIEFEKAFQDYGSRIYTRIFPDRIVLNGGEEIEEVPELKNTSPLTGQRRFLPP